MAAWQNPENFALWLSIVLIAVIAFVATFVIFTRMYFMRILQEQEKLQATKTAHQKQLLEDSILVQERERTRIAADLHDDLISKLNIVLLTLHATQNIEQATPILQNSITLARSISHDLSPPLLEEHNLLELIQDFVSPITANYKVKIISQNFKDKKLNSDTKLQIFRILQEVINNILKHAQATKIIIQIRQTINSISLIIQDNGIGFPKESIKGLGLKNITLRNQILKSQFKFKSHPQKGTTFIFHYTHHPQ